MQTTPNTYHVTAQPPDVELPLLIADGIPAGRLDIAHAIVAHLNAPASPRQGFPRMTEIRIMFTWESGKVDPVSLNWIDRVSAAGAEVDR